MKKKIKKLTIDELDILKSMFNTMSFSKAFNLVYEKQIPNTGIALVSGEIHLCRKSKILEIITPGCLLGVHYILNNEPVSLSCKVAENSNIILINKPDLLAAIEDDESDLHKIIKH